MRALAIAAIAALAVPYSAATPIRGVNLGGWLGTTAPRELCLLAD